MRLGQRVEGVPHPKPGHEAIDLIVGRRRFVFRVRSRDEGRRRGRWPIVGRW